MPIAPRAALFALLLAGSGCAAAAAKVDASKEEAEIRQLVSDWNGYLKARNDSAIAALYTADAVLLPPGLPRVSGSDKIRTFWAQLWPTKADLSLTTTSVRVASSGDLAVEEGNWEFAAGDEKDHGKYLVVWSKAGGSWKVVQDAWNSDQRPPAEAASAPAKGQ